MPDYGHELTERLLKKLERDIAKEYRAATKEATAKLKAYLEETEEKRKKQEALLKAGKITKKQYQDWCYRHTMLGKRWEQMRDTLAQDFHNANQIARGIAAGRMPDIYALNANYGTYQLEHDARIDTGFTLYNHDTAEYLLEKERKLMPGPSAKKAKEIAANKDLQWNMQKIQSAVLQGVLQGKSPYEVAKRLMGVGQMDYNAAVRYARTMATNAQNAGRYQAFRRADALGVDLTIEWQATLDGRTRHEHRLMHGKRKKVGEPFVVDGIEILWPAQPNYNGENIPQELIWNCRCTLLSWVKGFEGDTVKSSPRMGNMSFEEWQKATPHPDTQRDRKQYEEYKKLLKGKAPGSFREFQAIKYADAEKWSELKRKRLAITHAKDIIDLPRIAVGHSIGAKRKSFDILDLETGRHYDLADGTFIRNVQVFAGKGTTSEYRNASKFARKYGGSADDWQHVKGIAWLSTEDGDREAEIHWSQCDGVGRRELFVKRWLDE